MNGKESNTLVEWMEKKERGGEDGYGTYEQKAPSNHFPKRKWEVDKERQVGKWEFATIGGVLGVKSHGKVQKKIARTRLSLEGLATCEKMPKLVSACGGEKPWPNPCLKGHTTTHHKGREDTTSVSMKNLIMN